MQLNDDIAADRKRCSSWHTVPLDFGSHTGQLPRQFPCLGCRKALAQSHETAQARGEGVDDIWDDTALHRPNPVFHTLPRVKS